MFGNIFGNVFETYEVTFEIYIEDKLANKQIMQAPKEMLIANFLQTAEQIQYDKRPVKIRMTRLDTVWDDFENKQKTLTNEVAFINNAMIVWEENKQKGKENENTKE